jgi:hypothetical protein
MLVSYTKPFPRKLIAGAILVPFVHLPMSHGCGKKLQFRNERIGFPQILGTFRLHCAYQCLSRNFQNQQ